MVDFNPIFYYSGMVWGVLLYSSGQLACTSCLHGASQRLSNERERECSDSLFLLAKLHVSLPLLAVGCRAGEVLTVVHRATNSSVRRRWTSMVEYASIQGKV